MHLHRTLGGLESRPWKNGQAQINGGRVERIDGAVEIEAERFLRVHRPCGRDQDLGEVGVDAPVDGLVGIRQSGARDAAAEAHVIELPLHGAQTGLDIAQAFAIGQLREAKTKKLIQAGKAALTKIPRVTRDAFLKLVCGEMLHHLGEDCSANKHAPLSGLLRIRPPRLQTVESAPKPFKSKNLKMEPNLRSCLYLQPMRWCSAGH